MDVSGFTFSDSDGEFCSAIESSLGREAVGIRLYESEVEVCAAIESSSQSKAKGLKSMVCGRKQVCSDMLQSELTMKKGNIYRMVLSNDEFVRW